MAKTTIAETLVGSIKRIRKTNYPFSQINFIKRKVRFVNEISKFGKAKTTNYPISSINNVEINTRVTETLPFRVKFINIGIEGYGPDNPPPIGLAVIGFNNYIL